MDIRVYPIKDSTLLVCPLLQFVRKMNKKHRHTIVCLGVEFLKLELNFYSLCGFGDKKKICLGVEFFILKNIIF
jgi:hypothetical protein